MKTKHDDYKKLIDDDNYYVDDVEIKRLIKIAKRHNDADAIKKLKNMLTK